MNNPDTQAAHKKHIAANPSSGEFFLFASLIRTIHSITQVVVNAAIARFILYYLLFLGSFLILLLHIQLVLF